MPYTPKLKYLREDSDHVVYAQRPENIQPRVLSDSLVQNYGENHFQISLRRGVMVIYIDREQVRRRQRSQAQAAKGGDGEAVLEMDDTEGRDQGPRAEKMETYKRRYLDVKLAQKVLGEE